MNENKLDSVKKDFINYLHSLGISPKSHKNYKSDLTHFSSWVIEKVRSFGSHIETLTEAVPFLSESISLEYKEHMIANNTPNKTVNRRLSTLRHFSKSLLASGLIDFDFVNGIENISLAQTKRKDLTPIVTEFGAYLEAKKISKNTIKNYLSDTRQFLSWLENNNHLVSNEN